MVTVVTAAVLRSPVPDTSNYNLEIPNPLVRVLIEQVGRLGEQVSNLSHELAQTRQAQIQHSQELAQARRVQAELTQAINLRSDREQQRYMTAGEAARILKVKPRTIQNMCKDGRLIGWKRGEAKQARWIVDVDSVERHRQRV